MRMVMEWAKDKELLLVDGVKVLHDDGWALVFPDPEEPLTHVWAEAATDADAAGPGPGVRPADPQPAALAEPPEPARPSWRQPRTRPVHSGP